MRLLGVEHGVVALTKADAVDEETLELAAEEAHELVPGAEVVAVSAKTGEGLDELRAALARLPVRERDAGDATRLYVDRVFTLRGVGTVATGTLWSGSITAGDELRVEPSGRTVRVRSVQVHDAAVEHADAGQRVAVNLPQLERRDLARGDVLVTPGQLRAVVPTRRPAGGARTRARSGHGAHRHERGARARRSRRPVRAATPRERGRRGPWRPRRAAHGHDGRRRHRARSLATARPRCANDSRRSSAATQERSSTRPCRAPRCARLFSDDALAPLPSHGELVYSDAWLNELRESVHARLAARANAIDPGIPFAELLPEHAWALELLGVERQGAKAYLPGTAAALGDRAGAAAELEARLADEEIVKVDDRDLAGYLESEGRLRRVGDGYAVSPALYDRGVELLPTLQPITLAAFRDALGVGRRTAQLLLERYDADGLTLRRGDERLLRRRRG